MKDYKKYFRINASPEELYKALVKPMAIKLWSGEDAVMSTEVNSEFALFDGSIEGKNLAFEENKKIVQEWYFGDEANEASVVTIRLHAHADGTSVELRHINIPDDAFDNIVEGWEEVYFASLMDFFDED